MNAPLTVRDGLALPFPWLVADIGGTYARFGLIVDAHSGIQHVHKLPACEHSGPAKAAETYLSGLSDMLGSDFRAPRAAAFAVATAISGDWIELTNNHWNFSRAQTCAELELDALLLLNDFEALALSLPRLQASQLKAHHGLPRPQGTLAVIGPGTGLGVAGVVQTRAGWVALPGEGGHVTLAPTDEFENAILVEVRKTYAHVSAERLLSGIGLPVLYAAVATVLEMPVDATGSTTELIVEQGLSGEDPVASRTLDVFCALLGSFAGNVALTFGARSGVYIGGGIIPRLGERFFASRFREKFESKGRFRDYLEQIPTALITDTLAALTGAAAALEQHAI